MKPIKHLNPSVKINELELTLSTAELASISISELGKHVCSLKDK